MSTQTTEKTRDEYFAEAEQIMREKKVRWSEACRLVKKRHPQALAAFGGPDLATEKR